MTSQIDSRFEPETEWKSNAKEMRVKTFSIFASNKELCDEMVDSIRANAQRFVSRIQLEIALTAEKRASRTLTVSGNHIGKTKFFTQLKNMNEEDTRFLTSADVNKLSREATSDVSNLIN